MLAWYWVLAGVVGGFTLGFWRGRSAASMNVLDYWLTSTDKRVNWSRVTAMVGLGAFVAITTVFLHVYHDKGGEGMADSLLFVLGGALGLAGINLGQYLVSKKFPVGDTSSTTTTTSSTSTGQTGRQSGAMPVEVAGTAEP